MLVSSDGALEELTQREREIFAFMDRGLTNQEIADRLGISVPGVKYHVSQILAKLGVASRREVGAGRNWLVIAWRAGLGLAAAALVAGLVALAVAVILADGDESPSLASPSASPSPGSEAYDPGFVEFAARLEAAFAEGDFAFFEKSAVLIPYACDGNVFPAAGPNCVTPGGETVPALSVGAYGSEATIYDAVTLHRFLADWFLRYDSSANGAPVLYAIANVAEGSFGGLPEGTAAMIFTRIAPAFEIVPSRQEVLAFLVEPRDASWLVVDALQLPPLFLEPESPEVMEVFADWTRWDDVRSGGRPERPRLTGWEHNAAAERLVAYMDSGNALWLSRADGNERRRLAEGVCSRRRGENAVLSWSPPSDRIGAYCPGDGASVAPAIEVYDLEGQLLSTIESAMPTYFWSPDGTRIAYQTTEVQAQPPVARVCVAGVDGGECDVLPVDALLLDWPQPEQLLLGLNPVHDPQGFFLFSEYDAAWYSLDIPIIDVVPALDDNRTFWTHPGGDLSVVLGGPSGRKEGGATLAVLDLPTGAETPIPGAVVGYPSEGIPDWVLDVAPFSGEFVWSDWDAVPGAMYQAALDGTRVDFLTRLPGPVTDVSGDGLALYTLTDDPGVLVLEDIHTGATTRLSDHRVGAISPVPDELEHGSP
jgi:DNA-binding CsgD family transcriptional regulator